jgi:hypothetical protein
MDFFKAFTGKEEPSRDEKPPVTFDFGSWTVRAASGNYLAGPQMMIYPKPSPVSASALPRPPKIIYGDVRNLVTSPEFDGAMFQVASNFGALEFMDKHMTMADHCISWYPADHTQGPGIQVSALPQLLARYYFLPPNVTDMLALLGPRYGVRSTESGWADLSRATAPDGDAITKVGAWLVEKSHVAFGRPDGPVIPAARQNVVSLVMSAAYDFTYPAPYATEWADVFLRAAYLSLFSAAVDLRCGKIVMTLIGGGVFGNPKPKIAAAISWAARHTRWPSSPPQIFINLFSEKQHFPELDSLF